MSPIRINPWSLSSRNVKAVLASLVQYLMYVDFVEPIGETKDIIHLLKSPREAGTSLTGQWVFGFIWNELVIPMFGSIKQFYDTLVRLKQEGYGYT